MLDDNGLHAFHPSLRSHEISLQLCTSGLLEGVEVARASVLQCLDQTVTREGQSQLVSVRPYGDRDAFKLHFQENGNQSGVSSYRIFDYI